jgi:hypothetical protein
VYSDEDRFVSCNIPGLTDRDEISKVYDTSLQLLGSYHIIEWVRMTLFLITLLLGQNFMLIWYVLGLNSLYGIATYIHVHATYFSGNGLQCREEQEFRANMLMAEVIVFWVTFLVLSIPHIFFLCMKAENLEDAINHDEEDEEDEGEGEGKEDK